MKSLARLILSVEKMLRNPVKWFNDQPWFIRFILVLGLIPCISAISIISYQQYASAENQGQDSSEIEQIKVLQEEMNRNHEAQLQELIYMREEIAGLKELIELSNDISIEEGEKSFVLGINDGEVNDNLRQRVLDYVLTDHDETATKSAQDSDENN